MLKEYQDLMDSFLYAKDPGEVADRLSAFVNQDCIRGLGIYRQNLYYALLGTLQKLYPKTRLILTGDKFDELATTYLFENPSLHSDLGQYGKSFIAFIKRSEAAHIGQLMDVDWAWDKLFDLQDEACLTESDFQHFLLNEPEKLNAIKLIETAILIDVNFNIEDLFRGDQGTLAKAQEAQILLWRAGHKRNLHTLEAPIRPLISGLSQNLSLEQVKQHPTYEDPKVFGQALSVALTRGWLSSQ